MKFIFIADIFYDLDDFLGGGELNNHELILMLRDRDHEVKEVRSREITIPFLKQNAEKNFIIGNFMGLSMEVISYIQDNLKYVIYEHDHKYLTTRNPAMFEDFKAPFEYVIHRKLYKNAIATLCQSQLQKDIIEKNLEEDNLINLSGNLWSVETLELLTQLEDKPNDDKYAVLWSNTPHKNTADAIKYCEAKGMPYDLIYPSDNHTFIHKLSDYKGLVFFPKTPETLSRVVVEARMLNCDVIGNKLIGALNEPWFHLKGIDLINKMLDKRDEICDTVARLFN